MAARALVSRVVRKQAAPALAGARGLSSWYVRGHGHGCEKDALHASLCSGGVVVVVMACPPLFSGGVCRSGGGGAEGTKNAQLCSW